MLSAPWESCRGITLSAEFGGSRSANVFPAFRPKPDMSVLTTVFSLIPLLRSLTELGSGALPSVESCHRNRFSTILRALPRVRSGYAGISQVRTRDVPFDVPFDVPVKTLGFDAIRKSSGIYPDTGIDRSSLQDHNNPVTRTTLIGEIDANPDKHCDACAGLSEPE